VKLKSAAGPIKYCDPGLAKGAKSAREDNGRPWVAREQLTTVSLVGSRPERARMSRHLGQKSGRRTAAKA